MYNVEIYKVEFKDITPELLKKIVDKDLSKTAIRLFMYLCLISDEEGNFSIPNIKTVVDEGITKERMFWYALKELREGEFINQIGITGTVNFLYDHNNPQ